MKRFFRFVIKTLLWFGVLSVLWVLLYKYVPVPYTPLMAIRYFEADDSYETKHVWKPLNGISKEMQLAVICAEDQNFIKHNGFDYKAIKKAFKGNKQGKRIKGGSTISQQTAKNIFLWPERSWLRKGLEMYFTFLIENLWSKERILEVYLNSVEMGEGVYGAEAASQYWFNKEAKNLTRYEAASISAILPNPRNYNASPRTKYIESRKNWIVKQMRNYGTFEITEVVSK
jgi:monofunctional biosynthetic peptidoglycan transglycosylase